MLGARRGIGDVSLTIPTGTPIGRQPPVRCTIWRTRRDTWRGTERTARVWCGRPEWSPHQPKQRRADSCRTS